MAMYNRSRRFILQPPLALDEMCLIIFYTPELRIELILIPLYFHLFKYEMLIGGNFVIYDSAKHLLSLSHSLFITLYGDRKVTLALFILILSNWNYIL